MHKKVVIVFLFLTWLKVFSQQDAQFTQYMYNTININPAYAGSRGVLSVFGLYRNQWAGFDGAPATSTASINTPINNSNIGLGLSFISDKIGPSNTTNIATDVSYSIPTSNTFKLSFGLKATANMLNIDVSKLTIYNLADPSLQNTVDNKFSPNIGAGIYFHSNKTYFGFSIPNFLETNHFDKNASSVATSVVAKERMHYYAIGGHVFNLNSNIQFKPAFLIKAVQGVPLQLDISGNFLIQEKFTLGLAYRWDAAMSTMAGFQVNEHWFLGYGYDLETTKLANYNSGSHEIFLRYELFSNYNRIISPRFF